jgi:hypothetical protein
MKDLNRRYNASQSDKLNPFIITTTVKVSITATCGLVWHYQLSKKTMAFSLSDIEVQLFFFQVDT